MKLQTMLGKYTTCILCCFLFWTQWTEAVKAKVKNLNVTIRTGTSAGSTERPFELEYDEIWCDGYVWITANSEGNTEVYVNDFGFSKDPADLVVFSEIAYMNQGIVDASSADWSDMLIHVSATSSTSKINVRMDGGAIGKIDLGSDAPSGGINLEITGGSFHRYVFTGDVSGASYVTVRDCSQTGYYGPDWTGKGADKLTLLFDESVNVDHPRFIYEDLMPLKTKEAKLDLPFKPNANGVYEIHDANDFYWFEAFVDEYINDIDARLMNDIQIEQHTMIGSVESPYKGVFDGQGHTISGLNLGSYIGTYNQYDCEYAGLFSFVQGESATHPAVIRNLTVEGEIYFGFKAGRQATFFQAGGVVGIADKYVRVEDVVSKVNIECRNQIKTHIGGVVGSTEYSGAYGPLYVNRCTFAGSIKQSGSNACGGIVGYTKYGEICDCLNAGTITNVNGIPDSWVCGILGYVNNSSSTSFSLKRCLNVGTVSGANSYAIAWANNCPNSVFSQLYYKSGSASAVTTGSASFGSSCQSFTDAQLLSGEAAWKLNGSTSSNTTWRQNIGIDAYPLPDKKRAKVNYDNGSYANLIPKNGRYEITEELELVLFSSLVNRTKNTALNAVLTADMNMEGFDFVSIGTSTNPYQGDFDGQGHSVTLTIDNDLKYQGLIGCCSGTTNIKNVTMKGSVKCNQYAGLVGGSINGGTLTISGCTNFADVTTTSTGSGNAAGIYGVNMDSSTKLTIENCLNVGTISGREAGGISGWIGNGTVRNCLNIGKVTGTSADAFARKNAGTIENSYCYKPSGTVSAMTGATSVTTDELKSGKVANLLNNNKTDGTQAWYQTLGEDAFPILDATHSTVYSGYVDCYASKSYSNEVMRTEQGHHFADGICDYCHSANPKYMTAINGWYEIGTVNQLKWFTVFVNEGNPSVNAKLIANIVANNLTWIPIGTVDNPFAGTFDGQGFSISGLNCNDATLECTGLFGKTGANALIKHLTLSNCLIGGGKYAGSICGWNGGALQNCLNQNTTVSGQNAGGICGRNSGTISNCLSTGKVSLKK